ASHPAPGAGARRPALIVAGLAVLLLVAHPASALFSPLGRLTTASALISSLVSEATTLLLIALTAAGIQLVRRSRTDGDRLALASLAVVGLLVVLDLVAPAQLAVQLLMDLAGDQVTYLNIVGMTTLLGTAG